MEELSAKDLEEGQKMIDELLTILYTGDNDKEWFGEPEDKTQEKQEKEGKKKKEADKPKLGVQMWHNFELFDRDQDGFLSYDEVIELLNSLDINLPERDIKLLYYTFVKRKATTGINYDQCKLIVTKKKKDDDKETELKAYFATFDPDGEGLIKDFDTFKEALMTKGIKFSEQEADEFLEEANPKKNDSFSYNDFVKMILKRDVKGKKKKGGKKKK